MQQFALTIKHDEGEEDTNAYNSVGKVLYTLTEDTRMCSPASFLGESGRLELVAETLPIWNGGSILFMDGYRWQGQVL